MKRAVAFALALLTLVSAVGAGIFFCVHEHAQAVALAARYGLDAGLLKGRPELVVLAVPLALGMLFGLYSAAHIVHGLMSFEDISAAKAELDADVAAARKRLASLGVRPVAELRKASAKKTK